MIKVAQLHATELLWERNPVLVPEGYEQPDD
jgi:hypothetical protein